jgi:hypothetical protein
MARTSVLGMLAKTLQSICGLGRKYLLNYIEDNEIHWLVNRKIAPLNVHVDDAQPLRINLLIPEIDFRSFYGGYIAKFNLAQKLARHGNRVRIITVDQCDTTREDWVEIVRKYHGIEDVFEHIEVVKAFGREEAIDFNSDDVIIATTWWTAHIANALLPQLAARRFFYMIQEYEPFTFPMGSYYALAHESYSFPHAAIFSSPTLRDYFQNMGYGVFAHAGGAQQSEPFENAILTFDTGFDRGRSNTKKLLFYARPEPHAARNMFEIGLTALENAIRSGSIPDDWEFYGIGTTYEDINLPNGKTLQMLGKVGLKEYQAMLPTYDVGLALMYTPHPSLLPVEMAAAGQVVVTNSCMNKTAAALQAISCNFVVAEPTIPSVADALVRATILADDMSAREQGAQVNWSQDWDQTFSDELFRTMQGWFPAIRVAGKSAADATAPS